MRLRVVFPPGCKKLEGWEKRDILTDLVILVIDSVVILVIVHLDLDLGKGAGSCSTERVARGPESERYY